MTVVFATYNIQYTLGQDGRYDLDRVVETIKGADIIALQEVQRFFPKSGNLDQAQAIADLLPDRYWAFGPQVDIDASFPDATGKLIHRRQQEGNMLLSRWPILSVRNHLLPYVGTTSNINGQDAMIEGVIDVDGRALRVYSLHLCHLMARDRLAQIDWLLDLNKRVWLEGGVWSADTSAGFGDWIGKPMPPMPFDAVYLGDFNFDPRDTEYDRIGGPRDPWFGRVHYRDLLVDTWVAAGHDEFAGVTYKANERFPDATWRLDYGFVTFTLAKAVRRAWIDNDATGSDHQPYWFELDLKGVAQ